MAVTPVPACRRRTLAGTVGGLFGLLPGARIDPLALFDFALAAVLIVLVHDVRPRAWRWLFQVIAGTLIAVGFLAGPRE